MAALTAEQAVALARDYLHEHFGWNVSDAMVRRGRGAHIVSTLTTGVSPYDNPFVIVKDDGTIELSPVPIRPYFERLGETERFMNPAEAAKAPEPALTAATMTADTDPYYAQGQPRDYRGRWTKGMGMGVPDIAIPGDLSPLPVSVADDEARLLSGGYGEVDPGHIDDLLRDLPNHASINLEKLQVRGRGNEGMYRTHAREIPREKMPQLPENVEGLSDFRKVLDGTKAVMEKVDPRTLHATQNQLDSVKVGKLYGYIQDGGYREDSVLFASKDGAILDGHHRWAAAAAANAAGNNIKVTVLRVDTDIDSLLEMANKVSLERKAMGESFAMRKRHSFDEDQPTEPPPNAYEPWFWWDGKWWYVNTDGGDEVPTKLTLDQDDEFAAVAEEYRYNPGQPRDRRGRWTKTGGGAFWSPDDGDYTVKISRFPEGRGREIATILDRWNDFLPGSMEGLRAIEAIPNYPVRATNIVARYEMAKSTVHVYGDYDSIKPEMDDAFDTGWFARVPMTNRSNYVIAHEIGHHVALQRLTPDDKARLTMAVTDGRGIVAEGGGTATIRKIDEWWIEGGGMEAAATYLSTYAAEGGIGEFWGEALASGVYGTGPTADRVREWAKTVRLR